MKICVINFWKSAFEEDFYFYLLLQAIEGAFEFENDPYKSDIVFSSVFGNIPSPPEKTIMIIGENIRPDYTKCSFSFSFDEDSWNGKNIYMPLWLSRLNWPNFQYDRKYNHYHGNEPLIPLNDLTSSRRIDLNDIEEKKFCTFFASNYETLRMNIIKTINTYKNVDCYGPLFNNPVYSSKFEILKNYKFSFCAENSYYPGYVTEKLFDSYAGGNIPIYFGCLPKSSIINKRAFINYDTEMNSSELLSRIISLDAVKLLFQQMYCEPLLLGRPTIDSQIFFLKHCINSILIKSQN